MDPLSVATAVIGLLKTARQVSAVIAKIASSKKHGSKEINDVKITVDTLRSVLLQLQLLLLNRARVDQKRASMILVEEVVVTLTACVMTFSDLDGCVKGLESDEGLGILDSVRWASKTSELKGYLLSLEAHKTSLALMVNILSCQSAHNLENDAAELKVLMVRVLESNAVLAERMSNLESSQASSVDIRRDYEIASVLSEETIKGPDTDSSDPNLRLDTNRYIPVAHAFEEDLSKSWVYQRSIARGPRTFSIATSARLSQSWSMMSGVSLSNISNIAVQALPIYPDDLKGNHLYAFSEGGAEPSTNLNDLLELCLDEITFLKEKAGIESLSSRSSLPQSTAFRSQSNIEPRDKDAGRMPMISEESTSNVDFQLPAVEMLPKLDVSTPLLMPTPATETVISSGPLSTDSPLTITGVEIFRSSSGTGYNVMYLAASLFEFNISGTKHEAGYQYLTYTAGEVFDVLGEKGELWLAKSQDDPSDTVGWIWSKHFARLAVD